MSFFSVQPSKKIIFASEIKHTKHRPPPPPCLYEPLTLCPCMLKSSLSLELTISPGKNGSQARIVEPKVHRLHIS